MIIYLNGPSSSGKSSIAAALVGLMGSDLHNVNRDEFGQEDAHERLAELHDTGKDLIFDTVEYLPLMQAGLPWLKHRQVVLVGVFCSEEVLEAREQERGDRRIGLARSQVERMPPKRMYDLVLDSTQMTPDECASKIKEFIDRGRRPTAYARLPTVQYDSLGHQTCFGKQSESDTEAAFLADVLSRHLATETPETIAKVLINLDRTLPLILQRLSERVQGEVLYHLLRLQEAGSGLMGRVLERVGGVDAAAQILNRTGGPAERRVLFYLDEHDPDLSAALRNQMFTFADIAYLQDAHITEVLARVEGDDLVMALRGAGSQLRDRLLSCTTASARKETEETLASMRPVKKTNVEIAQFHIVLAARQLEEEGKIRLIRGEGEFLW